MAKALMPPIVVKPAIAYTLDEAVVATGVSRSSLYEAQAAGLIKFRKRGRTTLILTEELNRFMAELPIAVVREKH